MLVALEAAEHGAVLASVRDCQGCIVSSTPAVRRSCFGFALPSLSGTGRFIYPVSNHSVRTHLSTNLVNKGDNTSRKVWVNSPSHDLFVFYQDFTTWREVQDLERGKFSAKLHGCQPCMVHLSPSTTRLPFVFQQLCLATSSVHRHSGT